MFFCKYLGQEVKILRLKSLLVINYMYRIQGAQIYRTPEVFEMRVCMKCKISGFVLKAADIVEITKNMADGMQSQVLQCLLSEPGSYLFDSVTSSRTVSSIILNVSSLLCPSLVSFE